jgi:CubicO group peptidase (beta-lactamase class C family)
MKTLMMTAAVAVGIVINVANAAPLPEAKPDDVGFSQQGLARLDDFFAREILAKRVPGAVVAVARDGKLVHYKAYGQLDATKGTPMPLDAVFALASMTKPMAAVAGLTLMEQGRLPLQARLSEYYPAFAEMKVGVPQADGSLKMEAQASPITIHDLYRHTSGLMYGGRPDSSSPLVRLYPDGTAPAIEGDTQAFIDRITKLPLAHQPATEFEYGFSIDVLGAVIEKVS